MRGIVDAARGGKVVRADVYMALAPAQVSRGRGPDGAGALSVRPRRRQPAAGQGRPPASRSVVDKIVTLLGKKGIVSSELSFREALSGVLFLSQRMGLIVAVVIGAFAAAFVLRATASAIQERRRELAVLQAIGWRWRHIRRQVLIENARAGGRRRRARHPAGLRSRALGHISVTLDLPWDLSSTPHFIPEATLDRTQTITVPIVRSVAGGGDRGSRQPRRRAGRSHPAAGLSRRNPGRCCAANERTVMSETAIQVEGVTKRYGSLEVLRGVDLFVPAGSFTAIIGKSGSGKSTLLGVVSGLEKADAGRVVVQGQELSSLDEARMADLRRRAIGIVFQSFNLIPSLSALENTLLPTFFDTPPAAARRQRAIDLLGQVGLGPRMHHRPSQLSGGEQQRVAMARALVNRAVDPARRRADRQSRPRDRRRRCSNCCST